ncbi:MAG: XRE family transcriptional regulator, partial [Shewanella sp.]|nr:XRE family transcriptional regulator [Shewanella sp.]
SLRTIQRVERYGNASNDTLLGLCSVFEVNTADILACDSDITLEGAQINKNENVSFFSLTIAMFIGVIIGSLITWMIVSVI